VESKRLALVNTKTSTLYLVTDVRDALMEIDRSQCSEGVIETLDACLEDLQTVIDSPIFDEANDGA
jgi:hypothetical protein